MPTTYRLAPAFKWYFFDAEQRPAAGGKMYTYQNSTLLIPKAVYKDPAGSFPYPNPVTLDVDGGTPVPLYWEDDGVNKYFVVVKDADGNVVAQINDYPIDGGGGSTPVTSNRDIENYIINGQFYFIDVDFFNVMPLTVPQGSTYIAPGGGEFNTDYNLYSHIKNGKGSGWWFTKVGGIDVTDHISFESPVIGSSPPNGPSENAPYMFVYTATTPGLAITQLALQYIIPDVRAFSGESITISFDAACDSLSLETTVSVTQDFGSTGSPSPSVTVTAPFTFPEPDFTTRQEVQINVPSVVGKNLGDDENDRLIIAINIPPNESGKTFYLTNIQVEKTANATSTFIYKTYAEEQYRVLPNIVRNVVANTGDVKLSLSPTAAYGWIVLTDDNQTIGSTTSTAIFAGGIMRNLYILIYTSYSNANAPVNEGRSGTGTTIADAIADFNLNKYMRFPPFCGRILGNAGVGLGLPATNAYTFEGAREITLTEAQMPAHHHQVATLAINKSGEANAASLVLDYPGGDADKITSTVGSSEAHPNIQPTHYLYLHIKL